MDPTKFLTYIVLFQLRSITQVYGKGSCTNLVAKKPISGYHCPTDVTTMQLKHVTHHICTHYCISVLQCPLYTYSVERSICFAHKEICVVMIQDTEPVYSSSMFYGPMKQEDCISWMPWHGGVPDGERFVHEDAEDAVRYVARVHHNNEILPGRLDVNSQTIIFKGVGLVNGPTKVRKDGNSGVELLVVRETCSVIWIPYTNGNQMPTKAVVGGQKPNGGPLFVASLWGTNTDMDNIYRYGHYDPESQLGYTVNLEPVSNSSVDIMVEIWYLDPFIDFNRKIQINVSRHKIYTLYKQSSNGRKTTRKLKGTRVIRT